jgi:lysophospholipase L1-like esterase
VIVTLGDSVTFGFRIREGETYPEQLQAFLRDRSLGPASTVNYGVPGYTSWQGRRQLDRILARHRPDYVVLGFGANDIENQIACPTRTGPHGWVPVDRVWTAQSARQNGARVVLLDLVFVTPRRPPWPAKRSPSTRGSGSRTTTSAT